jgi:hypothetical protein
MEITIIILLLLFISTANGFSPGGGGTTKRHNTQTTHITQNNTINRVVSFMPLPLYSQGKIRRYP